MQKDMRWGLRLVACGILAGLIVGTGLAVACRMVLEAVTPFG